MNVSYLCGFNGEHQLWAKKLKCRSNDSNIIIDEARRCLYVNNDDSITAIGKDNGKIWWENLPMQIIHI